MSLINQMLQDLDARGAGAADGPMPVKPVPRSPRLLRRIAGTLGLLTLLILAAWFGWRARSPSAPGPMALAPVPAGMVRVTPPQPAPAAPVSIPAPAPMPTPPASTQSASDPLPALATTVSTPAPSAIPASAPRHVAAPAPEPAIPVISAQTPLRDSVTRSAAPSGARGSEAAYRRALADLQDGRVSDAIATLVRLLENDPRHDSARQTLVGLLVEAGRGEEALQQAERALALDARQPAMAMLAARLQLALREPGQSGAIDTLLRSLPYAQGNGDYHAFLAGVLQRQQRHGEAVLQYRAALAAAPGNAIWLMGLGISLQAERRLPKALAAFQQAGASATLPADLQAFVERKLQQLQLQARE